METPAPSCVSCRVTGALTLAGVSAWLLLERARLPAPPTPGHRAALAAMSLAFAGAAAWRASN